MLKDFVPRAEEDKENLYERIYLTKNPFPQKQILYEDKFVEFDEFNEKITDILNQFYVDGRIKSLVITGDNKMGKTHALFYIRYIVNTHIFPRYKFLRAVYLNHPPEEKSGEKGGFHYTYHEIIEGLGREFFELVIDEISKIDDIQPKTGKIEAIPDIEGYLKAKNITDDLSVVLDKWYSEGNTRDDAWSWICGNKLTKKEMTDLGVMRNIETSSRAIFILNEIIKCCRLIFNSHFGLCILLDEFEELVVRTEKRERYRYFADLRNLIDGVPEGLIFILGTGWAGWNMLKDYGALQVRLQDNMLDLEGLDEEEALTYAAKYLEWGQEEYCRDKRKNREDIEEEIEEKSGESDYYPFTKQEIIDIFRRGGGDSAKPGFFLSDLSKEIENKIKEFETGNG